jgi:hypothetical protein
VIADRLASQHASIFRYRKAAAADGTTSSVIIEHKRSGEIISAHYGREPCEYCDAKKNL